MPGEASCCEGGRGPVPSPAEPIAEPFDEPGPRWGGFIGALDRYVRQTLERASLNRPRASIAKPPMIRPGRAGRMGEGEVATGAIGRPGEDLGGPAALPAQLWFGPVSPNPSRGQVVFRFDLPTAAVVRIAVADIAGRIVHDLRGPHEAGRHTLAWSLGRAASSGVYFARLEVNGRPVGTRRLVVLR